MTDAQKRKKPWLTIVEKSDRSENLQAKTDKSQAKNEKHSKIEKNQRFSVSGIISLVGMHLFASLVWTETASLTLLSQLLHPRSLQEKSRVKDERKVKELTKKLEEAIALRQEAEAKLAHAVKKICELEHLPGNVKALEGPLPPPMPGGGGPPPPMPGMHGLPPPPPMPHMGLSPPPMLGMGGPPPPPMPGLDEPPPSPIPGMGSQQLPSMPGIGPLPPPGFAMPAAQKPDVLPHGLKPKKKWEVEGQLKPANWKAILPQKLSENSFWVKVQEEKLASTDILHRLAQKFSSKPSTTKMDEVDKSVSLDTLKKVKNMKVLDSKTAQNLSILLRGSLKHLSYADVRSCILQCDNSVIPDHILQQLIMYFPPPDQQKKLEDFRGEYHNLNEAEKFAVTLVDIKMLLPRLKSMSFKLHFNEMVQDIKPDIVAAAAACEEVKSSKKFAQILELILLVGNYMNTASKNGQAFGFEISFLPKLTSTKDVENKLTLLHYLVETIETKFPDLLTFSEELAYVDKAARVSVETVQKTLHQMDVNIQNLETDLKNIKQPQGDDDKFGEVMGTFSKEARSQHQILDSMFKNMESLYADLSEFYAFDKQKYSLEEFFTDIKTFKDAFLQAHLDNLKLRETEEKVRKAHEAREKAEQERADRAMRKRALVDTNADQTQEGVVDSLLEALQTGSATSRDQIQKRTRRKSAGAEGRAQLNRSHSRSGLISGVLTDGEMSSELLSTA